MTKQKLALLVSAPALLLGALTSLTGCSTKYDLVIYNWEDYIYEGTDDDGNYIEDGTIAAFEKYYQEKTGQKIKVGYECFSTNEEMYQQISLGSISPDLICPSDYMIQKMANENMLEEFSYDATTDTYADSLKNWADYGSPFIRERFANETLANGSSFLQYAIPYFWGTMGFTYDPSFLDGTFGETVKSWECLWSNNAALRKQFSLKDSMRDTYVTAIFHVYKEEIAAIPEDAAD